MVPISTTAMSLFQSPQGTLQFSSAVTGAVANIVPGAGINADSLQTAGSISASGVSPFGDLLVESIGQVDQLERQARSSVEGLISGRGVDVHEAMIATEKAEMGFELVLSVRNKALAAYQQVMGMQF